MPDFLLPVLTPEMWLPLVSSLLTGMLIGLDRELQAWVLEHSPIAPWELDSGFIPD